MKQYYFTTKQLREMQNKSFNDKVQISLSKVLEIITKTQGKIYVAYSGGKDSGVILHMVAQAWSMTKYKEEPLTAALANTTCEYRGMLAHAKKFVKHIENEFNITINFVMTYPTKKWIDIFKEDGYPIASKQVARRVRDIRKIMEEKNISYDDIKDHLEQTVENANYLRSLGFNDSTTSYLCGILSNNEKSAQTTLLARRWLPLLYAPFKVSPVCCDYLKKKPQNEIDKKLNLSVILGELAEESKNRETAYKKTGCVNYLGKGKYKGKPLGFWTENDILEYTKWKNLPLFEYYGEIVETENCFELTGMKRTGCKICLFGCQFPTNGIHVLKELEPKAYKILLKPISQGGCGYGEVIKYLNDYCGCSIDISDYEIQS